MKHAIKGFDRMSLVDWDGMVATTLYTGGCNFRCPYCHNSGLVLFPDQYESIPVDEILDYVREHNDFIDGVVITGHGGAWRLLRRVGPGQARRLLFGGQRIDADEALHIGLCDVLGSAEELDRWIETFLDSVRLSSALAIAETKAMLRDLDATARRQSCELEAAASTRLFGTDDTVQRIQAFLSPAP